MRIAMIGQKGVPATHGGVERHVEELGVALVALGHEVTVFTRSTYSDPSIRRHRGMRLVSLPTIGTKHLDAIVHSILASFAVWQGGYEVVHYHAIGPCLASPISRARGRLIVATIHSQDWRQSKWGALATALLRLGEWMALRIPHATICVSRSLTRDYHVDGTRRVVWIPNGVSICSSEDSSILAELGIEEGRYLLFVGRLIPDKGLEYLIRARGRAAIDQPLVIAGDSILGDDYGDRLRAVAGPGVIFAGFVYGARLATLFRYCTLFVLPSDVEGMSIVLLEAQAYGAPVLASDIAPNRDVLASDACYFRAGDESSLSAALVECLAEAPGLTERARTNARAVAEEYSWSRIAQATAHVYERVVNAGTD